MLSDYFKAQTEQPKDSVVCANLARKLQQSFGNLLPPSNDLRSYLEAINDLANEKDFLLHLSKWNTRFAYALDICDADSEYYDLKCAWQEMSTDDLKECVFAIRCADKAIDRCHLSEKIIQNYVRNRFRHVMEKAKD